MKIIPNKLRIVHFPQVGTCKESFEVDVKDETEAFKIMAVLIDQHLWLYDNRIIPDYSNSIFVEMFDDELKIWVDYWNENEEMDWEELEEAYFF